MKLIGVFNPPPPLPCDQRGWGYENAFELFILFCKQVEYCKNVVTLGEPDRVTIVEADFLMHIFSES